ncbi:hypothetical protein R1flu_011770 [Riccia fluitans]|uniref:Prion-inhibition and propagation HeLo domain-containing protein n=1 Tax=Riccia fluitans TaxID=41844 RepID=A0ABD1Z8X9_9MARC
MISMGLIGFGDTLLSLRQKLEDIRTFESAFQFWDSRLGSPVHMKLEALIFVKDLEKVNREELSKKKPFINEGFKFEAVAKILTAAKKLHGITRDVVVIMAEDETRMNPTMRWKARLDMLMGFCGDEDNHVYMIGLEEEVGLGPVLGHASDGDVPRRKLMLKDYLRSEGQRWTIGWDGWVLSGLVLDSGDVYALGDQDPIHNRKKMINPLDRSSYLIVLGDFHTCLEHVQLVYKLYSHDHHDLNIDDVMRWDRQNWAAALEYGKEVVKLSKAHMKQKSLWARLHPLPLGHAKSDLSDFARLATDDQITKALKVGLQQAHTQLTQLNMFPHARVRDKTWWRTPWTLEKELGIYGTSSSTQEPKHEHFKLNDMEEVEEMPNSDLSSNLWDILEAIGALSTMDADVDAKGDETND